MAQDDWTDFDDDVAITAVVSESKTSPAAPPHSVDATRQDRWRILANDLNWSEATRNAIAEALTSSPALSRDDIVLSLLAHQDHRVRRDGLDAVLVDSVSERLRREIAVLAAQDADPVCQAKSRLLLAGLSSTKAGPPARTSASRRSPRSPTNQFSARTAGFEFIEWDRTEVASPEETLEMTYNRQVIAPADFTEFDLPPLPNRSLAAFPDLDPPDAEEVFSSKTGMFEPNVLDRPLDDPGDIFTEDAGDHLFPLLMYAPDAPSGYSGKSGVMPVDAQENSHFVPLPDRWRSGYSRWDRYGKGHPAVDDYPLQEGHWWDPYNLNVLKGDYPVVGQHTFLKLTGQINSLQEYRQLPVGTTPFESTVDPKRNEFFGDPNQYFTTNYFKLSVELFHGNASFKPVDWSIRFTPIFNINYLDTEELGLVNPDVRKGTTRYRDFMALEEYFVEGKLKDLSPDYDFLSLRVGSQPFTSDFRGFIFSDTNRAIRLFGTRLSNRDQFNIAVFRQAEKETNSQLNTFENRNQTILIANYYRQDFIFPGYTAQANLHYNNDGPSVKFDRNDFLARPDPAGVFQPHRVSAVYFGLTGDGHIDRFNVNHAFYWVVGHDSQNPISGTDQNINAKMGAVEISYDRDWIRFHSSFFYASGDRDPYDHGARGFDSILDNPNFAGGSFSYWQRQQISLLGVSLVNRFSLVPDLRSSKFEGQSNFVNPGLKLINAGADFELTPKAKLIANASYLEFDTTRVLEAFTFQSQISRSIGVDLSLGLEYRPLLNDNVILTGGYACLLPGAGFKDLYGKTSPFTTANARSIHAGVLSSAFMQMILQY